MFTTLLIILATSLLVISLFRRLRLPPVLGYLGVGLSIGPRALGWVNDSQDLSHLAEMGVVFLLFALGLEFSLPRLLALRRLVFGLGSLQVLVCGGVLAAACYALGFSSTTSLLLGACLALSSTAIVTKELSNLGEVFSRHGQNAIGVLLFQDLVAVLLLTLVPALAGDAGHWSLALTMTLGKAALLFVVLLVASRWLLPRLFHEVAAARSAELLVLLALVLVLLVAWLTQWLGLSMALGAFFAGMLLGESHYRHQIQADIRPFRDILLGLFFVSVGMLIDLRLFATQGMLIAGLTLALMLVKATLVGGLVRLRGDDAASAWRSGLTLAQGSEFCFVLLAQAQLGHLLAAEDGAPILAAVFCSMALTPLLLRGAPRLARWLEQRQDPAQGLAQLAAASAALQGHVLICGYGRVGQSIGRFLRRERIEFLALDDDPVRVREAAAGESSVHFGDSRRGELLAAMGVHHARLLVVAVDNAEATLAIVRQARLLQPDLAILVRTRDDSQLSELQAAGATDVVPEVLESSLMLAAHTLLLLGLPEAQVQARVHQVRQDRYRLLHGYYPGAQVDLLGTAERQPLLMHAVTLSEDAYGCGQRLDGLALEALGVEVQGLRRDDQEQPRSQPLQAGDTVLLSGPLEAIERGEARLLGGFD